MADPIPFPRVACDCLISTTPSVFREPHSGKKCSDCFIGDPGGDDERHGITRAAEGEYCQHCGHRQGCTA